MGIEITFVSCFDGYQPGFTVELLTKDDLNITLMTKKRAFSIQFFIHRLAPAFIAPQHQMLTVGFNQKHALRLALTGSQHHIRQRGF